MTRSGRFASFALSLLLLGGLSVTAGAVPASATITTLCKGYTGCAKAGMSNSGYAASAKTMWWRMYSGHNCTNYAAYRMIRAGLPNSRPWTGSGNATYWGSKMSSITNATPRVGSVAWWRAGVKPAGSAGHVAYVERVVSANEIIVSQDSWNGDFSWTRILRSGTGWPSGFIHFKDVPLLNTKAPAITGAAKVGSTLTASAGTWSQTGTTLAYQWLQNGVAIAGATRSTLTPVLAHQGKRLSVRVTAAKLGFPTTAVVSASTAAVLPGVITNTIKPAVSGDAQVGSTLSVTSGSWNPAPDQVRYQWQAGGAPIAGATQPTYTVDPERAGAALSVAVTAVKAGYPPVTTTSALSEPVAPGTMTLRAQPTVAGGSRLGATISLVLPDVPAQSRVAVQWMRGYRPVAGATARSYRLTAADAGSRMQARVTVTRPGYRTLTTRTTWSSVIRATPVIRVTSVAGTRRLAIYAAVGAVGVRPVPGVVQVRSRGRLLGVLPLTNGIGRGTLAAPRGNRVFRFRYVTTTKVAGGTLLRRIKIG